MKSNDSNSKKSRRFFGVQILRAFASLLVVFHHAAQVSTWTMHGTFVPFALLYGSCGVDIFFPISGMVMFITAGAEQGGPSHTNVWKHFMWRRIIRVVPLYYLFTALKLGLYFAIPSTMPHYRFGVWHTIASLLFLPAYNSDGVPEPVLPVGWTLAYEMFFYLIVGVALLLGRNAARFATTVILPLAIIGMIIPHYWGGLTHLADPIELEFLAGMLVALLLLRGKTLPGWLAATVFLASLTSALVLGENRHLVEFTPTRTLVWGIPGALMLLAVGCLEEHINFRRMKFLLLLGDASYILYLSHPFIVPAVGVLATRLHWSGALGSWAIIVFASVFSVAMSIPLHLWVEKPILKKLGEQRLPWSAVSAETTPLSLATTQGYK